METHPSNPNVLLSVDDDGNVFVWDIEAGSILKRFKLEVCVRLKTGFVEYN